MIEPLLIPLATVVDAKNRQGTTDMQPDFLSEMLKSPVLNASAERSSTTAAEIGRIPMLGTQDGRVAEAASTWNPNLPGGSLITGERESDTPSMSLHAHPASPGIEIDVPVASGQTHALSPGMKTDLPMTSEIQVIEVVTTDTDRIAVAAPWRLLASWLLAQSERVGGPVVTSEEPHARDIAGPRSGDGVPSSHAVVAQTSESASSGGTDAVVVPDASRTEGTSLRGKGHEIRTTATESVIASHAWQARLLKLLEHATQSDAKAWVRDFRLSESDIKTLTSELRGFFAANGKQLTSIWINGRNTWLKARDE